MKKLSQKMLTGLVLGSLMACGTAFAAEVTTPEFELDEIIVTATRTEKRDVDVPAAVTVVTADEMQKTGANTIYDALRRVVGITPYSYSADGDSSGSNISRLIVRGFDKGALILLNGAPVNINNYATVSGLPLAAIEKIEIVKGSNSVLYGAEALSGVVNIITKKSDGKTITSISGTTGSYLHKWNLTTQGKGYLVSVGKDYKDKYNHASVDRNNASTKTDRLYRVNNNYTREYAFGSFDLTKNLNLSLEHSEMNPSYASFALPTGSLKSTTANRYDYKDRKNFVSLKYDDSDKKLKSVLSYNEKRVESIGYLPDGKINSKSPSSNYKYYNLFWDTQKTFDIGANDHLTVGVDMKHESYDQNNKRFKTSDFDLDNARNAYGVYASYDKKFSDKFNAILGVRGQYYTKTDWEESHKVFLPQLQTVYKIDDNNSWYTNIGKGFELSALNGMASAGGTSESSSAIAQVAQEHSPKPESGWNYETGYKHVTDSTTSKVSLFHMDYKNKFAWKHFSWMEDLGLDSKAKIQVNLGKFRNTGLEYEFKKKLSDKWQYDLGLTYQKPEAKDGDKWDQEGPRLQGKIGVDYTIGKFSANLNGVFIGLREDSYYKYNGDKADGKPDHRVNEYIQLNAGFAYRPSKNHEFNLNFYNILDRIDCTSEYEYYTLPMNWTISYTMKF